MAIFCRSSRQERAAVQLVEEFALDAGGAAGDGRFRAARMISATLPPRIRAPPMSSPIATQSKNDSLAP